MVVAALLVVPSIVLDAEDPQGTLGLLASALRVVIWLIFVLEAAVLLSLSGDRARWMRSHPLELAVIVLTPPFVTAVLGAVGVLRLVRVVRLLRLVRLLRFAQRIFTPEGVRWAAGLAAFTAIFSAGAFVELERDAATESSYTFADGLYWAISTMTTVGYGDIAPTTSAARLLAVLLMLVGIGFVAVVTGAIAERFVGHRTRHDPRILAALDDLTQRLDRLESHLRTNPPPQQPTADRRPPN